MVDHPSTSTFNLEDFDEDTHRSQMLALSGDNFKKWKEEEEKDGVIKRRRLEKEREERMREMPSLIARWRAETGRDQISSEDEHRVTTNFQSESAPSNNSKTHSVRGRILSAPIWNIPKEEDVIFEGKEESSSTSESEESSPQRQKVLPLSIESLLRK